MLRHPVNSLLPRVARSRLEQQRQDFAVRVGLGNQVVFSLEKEAQGGRVDDVAVVGQNQRTEVGLDEERAGIDVRRRAAGGVAIVPDRPGAGQMRPLRENLLHQPHAFVEVQGPIVAGDAGALLSTVLQRMQAQNRKGSRIRGMNAHHSAFVTHLQAHCHDCSWENRSTRSATSM